MSVTYDFDLVSFDGQGVFSLGKMPSINDNGYVAFGTRRQSADGKEYDNIAAYDPVTTNVTQLMNGVFEYPRAGDAPRQEFSDVLQIDNSNQVLAWRHLAAKVQIGFPFGEIMDMPLTYIERWDADGVNSAGQRGVPESQVVMGDAGIGSAAPLLFFISPSTAGTYPSAFRQYGFSAVTRWSSINNHGQVAFGALTGSGRVRVTGPHGNPNFLGGGISVDYKPVIADSGDVVFSTGGALYVESFNFSRLSQVAGAAGGFTSIGTNPGITKDGKVVTFYASLSTSGANALNLRQGALSDPAGRPLGVEPVTPGPGVFLAADTPYGWLVQRVAGVAGNGLLDAGESFVDANGNGILDGGETDLGYISGFDPDSRVAVVATGGSGSLNRVVFTPYTGGAGHALVTADLFALRANGRPDGHFDPATQQVVAVPGQTIALATGGDLDVSDVSIGDPINEDGQIAFWVNTSAGQRIVRALPNATSSDPSLEVLARALVYGNEWDEGEQISHDGVPLDYTVIKEFKHPTNGFYALGLMSQRYGPAIVFRGSDGIDMLDWWANSDPRGVGYNQFESHWDEVHQWLDQTFDAYGPIDFAGQSLGGALTQKFASEWTQARDSSAPGVPLIDKLVTFNSPGISKADADAFGVTEVGDVVHYIVNGDIVSMVGEAYVPGQVRMANWDDYSLLGFNFGAMEMRVDKHQLPLTVPRVTFPPDIPGVRLRPSGITWQAFPDVAALNSPSYVHTANDYKLWIGGGQIVANALAGLYPWLSWLRGAPDNFTSRAKAEAHRHELGEFLRATGNKWVGNRPTAERLVITLANSGDKLLDGTRFILDNSVTLSLSTATGALDITGRLGVDRPGALTFTLPDTFGGALSTEVLFSLVDLDASGTITASGVDVTGDINLLGGVARVGGSLHLAFDRPEVTIQGASSFLGGFLTGNDVIRFDGTTFTATGLAAMSAPEGLPWIGGASFAADRFDFRFSVDGNYANDFLSYSGSLLGFVLGLRVYFDGRYEWLGAQDVPPLPEGGSDGRSFEFTAGTTRAVMGADWSPSPAGVLDAAAAAGAGATMPPAIRLVAPDGTVYDEAAIAADPRFDIEANATSSTRRSVRIVGPAPGVWRIELVDRAGLGTVRYAALNVSGTAPPPPPAWLAPGSVAVWEPGSKTLTVTGPATITGDPGSDAPVVLASGSAAALTIDPVAGSLVTLGGLHLSNNASATMTAAGAVRVLEIARGANLTLDGTTTLDLADNVLVVRNATQAAAFTSHASINGLVRGAFNEFGWSGTGISSSTAAADVANGTPSTLGILLNNDGAGGPLFYGAGTASSTFMGAAVDANTVIVRFTRLGDGDLNGNVDTVDFALFQAGYTGAGPYVGFAFGDYDYSGGVDTVDFGLFQAGYPPGGVSAAAAAVVAEDDDEDALAVAGSPLAN